MSYKYIFFDLDGTITESGPGIMNSVAYALAKFGIEEKNPEILARFVGPPLVDSFMRYYDLTKDQALDGVSYYREYYGVKGIFENLVYDGVTDMLKRLSELGYHLAVATSKPEEYTLKILKHFLLEDYFELVAGATMDQSRTSKKDVIRYALSRLPEADPSEVIMVGDRENDIAGAKANGLKSIGVLYGYGSFEELEKAGADYIVERPVDVAEVITNL